MCVGIFPFLGQCCRSFHQEIVRGHHLDRRWEESKKGILVSSDVMGKVDHIGWSLKFTGKKQLMYLWQIRLIMLKPKWPNGKRLTSVKGGTSGKLCNICIGKAE